MSKLDEYYMRMALTQAKKAFQNREVPIGAVLVKNDQIIGRGHNQVEQEHCALRHAEMTAIRDATNKTGAWRLIGTTLYVTLEPCVMCCGAIVHSRIDRVVFGAYDHKRGGVVSQMRLLETEFLNHQTGWKGGVLEQECRSLLSRFFLQLRKKT